MEINIKNCKNIDNGLIKIESGKLNIKYAINGTGKSSIAQAIEHIVNAQSLENLTPYKYLDENPIQEEHKPCVSISGHINSIAVFNEDYVRQYIFQASDLLANSFEVFVKTPDYDIQMIKIQELIKNISETFNNNPNIDTLINELSIFINGFGKAKNGYSKNSTIGHGIAKGNKIENIPKTLIEYKPFIQSEKNAKWLSWQEKGEEFLDYADNCPYCANELTQDNKSVVKQVAIEYNSKYISELQKMLSVFNSLNEYFAEETKNKILQLSNSSTELQSEQINFLVEVNEQVKILHQKLQTIKNFNFGTLKDVDAVITTLTNNKIHLPFLNHLNSPHTHNCILLINTALDSVIEKAGVLQGEIAKHKQLIAKTIKKYNGEINGFLQSAGYQYCVDIVEEENNSNYKTILKYKETGCVIDSVKEHLSYGERNAFALVLFMYRVIKDNPDLIILDDPISSFDFNKKYAIMEKLFKGQNTLQGKTVIMLTHDFDPVVDLIHTSSIKSRFYPLPVACFLYNQDGILNEKQILSTDIQSFFELAVYNISHAPDEINRLIYLRRFYEACGQKNMGWQLLSNIFHPNRETPLFQQTGESRPMTTQEIEEGTSIISERIPDFDYNRVYTRAHNLSEMIKLYKNTHSNYEKIQIYRLINHGNISDTVFKKFVDEVYHIENDNLFQLNPSKFPTIPHYIIKLCDNGIEILESNL